MWVCGCVCGCVGGGCVCVGARVGVTACNPPTCSSRVSLGLFGKTADSPYCLTLLMRVRVCVYVCVYVCVCVCVFMHSTWASARNERVIMKDYILESNAEFDLWPQVRPLVCLCACV